MEYQTENNDPAPALGRGLKLLHLLQANGACSLEQLATETDWPKTSVLRLLQSLMVSGAVARDPETLAYRAVMRLVPVDSGDQALRRHCAATMAALCAKIGHTVELHRFDHTGLEMIDRQEPPAAVVCVVARVGWRRTFDEFDSLTQVALAFSGAAEVNGPFWYWQEGRKHNLQIAEAKRLISVVRRRGHAVDMGINEHGVRRYAAPILKADGRLRAVLAVAQVCPPHAVEANLHYADAVHEAAEQLRLPA